MKKIIIWLIILVIIFLLAKGWWDSQFSAVSSDTSTKVVVIAKGAGVSAIAAELKQDNLIKSELAFKVYVSQNNLGSKLQAGSFKLSPSMSVAQITKNLQTGSADAWVTLIEGWRVEEMADQLNQDLNIDKKAFLGKAKEGYMFPDTYLFPKEATVEYIVSTLEKNFDNKYDASLQQKILAKGLTANQGVILASIVEREARSDKVRTAVASILLKRLKIGMALDADSTVQYALGYQPDQKSWWKKGLSLDDLKIDSSFNTYLHAGLPPTPICNPSLSSLNAVVNADSSTPYLYYYHDSKGNSYYATTLEEHNANVANHP